MGVNFHNFHTQSEHSEEVANFFATLILREINFSNLIVCKNGHH